MRPLRLAALGSVAAVLAGCVVGPAYRTPPLPGGAAAPLVSVDSAAETAARLQDDWWRLYNDPRLDGLITEAFAANADLSAAEANLSGARAILEASQAGRYPSTTALAGAVHGRDAATDQILEIVGHKPESIWKYDTLFSVAYEVDLFGRVRRSIEASRADAEAVAAARDGLKVTVAAETARAYAQICTLGEQIDVARHALQLVSRSSEITTQRRLAGANSEFDEVRTQALVAQVRATLPPLESQRRAALFQLTALLGRTPSRAPAEVEACVAPPRLSALMPVGDGAALLKRRPDVRQAERRLAAATARIGVATADLYPHVSLTGLYGGVGSRLSYLSAERGLTWGVGPSVSWSFPIQAAPRARVRQARAGADAALAVFDAVVLQALNETEQALAVYGAELDRRRSLADAHDLALRAFELANGQFLAGSLSQLELLVSEQALVASDAAAAASDAAIAQDQVAVFKALGGGWRSPPK